MSAGGYLVQYGRSAFVGRFVGDVPAARDDRVVVRTPRGLELGLVLCEAPDRFAGQLDALAGGEVLRLATPADLEPLEPLEHDLLAAADELASGLPLTVLDAEVMLDRAAAVVHVLPWAACDADPVFAELCERFAMTVRMLDVSRTATSPDPATGCGKPDCGSGGCGTGGGCSSGSCSRGSVKSADELTAYFADLRKKMEDQAAGRTTLL
jgi:hypothetical protein